MAGTSGNEPDLIFNVLLDGKTTGSVEQNFAFAFSLETFAFKYPPSLLQYPHVLRGLFHPPGGSSR